MCIRDSYPNRLDPETWPRESAGKMIQTSELFRYFIRRADLEDPAKTHVPANGSWVRVQPWLPWMLMGQTPGHVLYDGVFRSYRDTKYFPEPVLERIRSRLSLIHISARSSSLRLRAPGRPPLTPQG